MSRVDKYEVERATINYFERALDNAKKELGYKAAFKIKSLLADANISKMKFRKRIQKGEYYDAKKVIWGLSKKLPIDDSSVSTLISLLENWNNPLDWLYKKITDERDLYVRKLITNRIMDYIESNFNNLKRDDILNFLKTLATSRDYQELIDSRFKKSVITYYLSRGDYKTILEISHSIDISKETEDIIKNLTKKKEYEKAYKLASLGIEGVTGKISMPLQALKTLNSLIRAINSNDIKTKTDAEMLFQKIFTELKKVEKGKKYWEKLGFNKFGEYEKIKLQESQLKAEIKSKISKLLEDLNNELESVDRAFLDGIIDEKDYEEIIVNKKELRLYIEKILEQLTPKMSKEDVQKRIKVLEKLYREGKISREEYEQKKRILESRI